MEPGAPGFWFPLLNIWAVTCWQVAANRLPLALKERWETKGVI